MSCTAYIYPAKPNAPDAPASFLAFASSMIGSDAQPGVVATFTPGKFETICPVLLHALQSSGFVRDDDLQRVRFQIDTEFGRLFMSDSFEIICNSKFYFTVDQPPARPRKEKEKK